MSYMSDKVQVDECERKILLENSNKTVTLNSGKTVIVLIDSYAPATPDADQVVNLAVEVTSHSFNPASMAAASIVNKYFGDF